MSLKVTSAASPEPGAGERGPGRCWGLRGLHWSGNIQRLVSGCVGGREKHLGVRKGVRGEERIVRGVRQGQRVCVCVWCGRTWRGGLPVPLWDGDWACESGEVGWGVHTCGHTRCVCKGTGKENLRVGAWSSCTQV